jgi:hypothetical protein
MKLDESAALVAADRPQLSAAVATGDWRPGRVRH